MLNKLFLLLVFCLVTNTLGFAAAPLSGSIDPRIYWEIKDPKSLTAWKPQPVDVKDPKNPKKTIKVWSTGIKFTDETGKAFPHEVTYLKEEDAQAAYDDAKRIIDTADRNHPLYVKLEGGTGSFPGLVQGNQISSSDIILVLKEELNSCLGKVSACEKNTGYEQDARSRVEKKGVKLQH